jgi:hypothetical protein
MVFVEKLHYPFSYIINNSMLNLLFEQLFPFHILQVVLHGEHLVP